MEFQDGGHGGHLVFPHGTNFESNLAEVVPYHPLKFQIDQLMCLPVTVQKQNFKMAAILFFSKWHQVQTHPSLGGALPPC